VIGWLRFDGVSFYKVSFDAIRFARSGLIRLDLIRLGLTKSCLFTHYRPAMPFGNRKKIF